jgi:hypothetical protein
VNREQCELPARAQPPLPKDFAIDSQNFATIHTFLAYGNADSQFWQVRFTLWQAQFTLWVTLFGREMARYGEVLTDFAIPTQDFAKPFLLLSRHSLRATSLLLSAPLSLVVAFLSSLATAEQVLQISRNFGEVCCPSCSLPQNTAAPAATTASPPCSTFQHRWEENPRADLRGEL